MNWQKFVASDAIIYGFKETVNNVRLALYSMLILLCEVVASLLIIGLPTLIFALWQMPSLRAAAVQIREAFRLGSYGALQALLDQISITQMTLSVKIIFALAILIFLILCSMFAAGYIRMIIKFHDTGSANLRELCMGWHRGPRLLLAGLIFFVSISLGLCLFVIPGIYILVHGILFPFFIVDKNAGVIDSFKKSYASVSGYGWHIGAVILVGLAMNFNPIIIVFVCFTKLLMYANAYRRLTT